jgi:hypothetical protein
MTDAPDMQQLLHKRTKHKTISTSEKQEGNKLDSQTEPKAENCKAYSWVSHQAPENERALWNSRGILPSEKEMATSL